MSDRVLYYPHINVPQNEWFSRVALYWEQVGCILPDDYDPRGRGSPTRRRRAEGRYAFTRELIDCELVRRVNPSTALQEVPDFAQTFLELIDSDPLVPKDHHLDARRSMAVKVHTGKLGEELIGQLEDRGLAEFEGLMENGWCVVERRTAELYVAYLATQLGSLPRYEMTPITDELDSLKAFKTANAGAPLLEIPGAAEVREVILERLLPAPFWATPFELADFKQQRIHELRRFRREVDAATLRICAFPDPAARALAATQVIRDLEEGLKELAARMREHGWADIGWGSIAVAATLGGSAVAAGAGAIPAALTLAGLAVSLRTFRNAARPRGVGESPLAYAALASEEFAHI